MEPRAHRIVVEACKAQVQREGVHGEMRLRTAAPRIVAACVTVRAAQGGRSMGSCNADSSAVYGAAPAATSCLLLLRRGTCSAGGEEASPTHPRRTGGDPNLAAPSEDYETSVLVRRSTAASSVEAAALCERDVHASCFCVQRGGRGCSHYGKQILRGAASRVKLFRLRRAAGAARGRCGRVGWRARGMLEFLLGEGRWRSRQAWA